MTIEDRFKAAAQAHPKQPAITAVDGVWCYSEVWSASEACARHLRALQEQTQCETVAILATRSASLPIVVLACLQARLPFTILDTAYPETYLVEKLQVLPSPLLLGLDVHPEALEQRFQGLASPQTTLNKEALRAMTELSVESLVWPTPRSPSEVAYYLFTSGSTGTPKCIETPVQPLAHFLDWYTRVFRSAVGTRYAMLSGLGHDPIFRDMLAPLLSGGLLCIPEQSLIRQPRDLYQWLQTSRIERLHTTPPMLDILGAAGDTTQALDSLAFVFSGGDVLRAAQVERMRALAPNCQVVNFYGTSETPQAVAWYAVAEHASDPIPIGQGIDGVNVLVLDEHLQPVSDGVQGQVAVQSAYLSLGYRGQQEVSRRQYVTLGDNDVCPTYLTGDLGHVNAQGQVVLSGRADDQISLHGHRIELGAIHKQLLRSEQVTSAVILPIDLPSGERKLCAYVVGHGPHAQDNEPQLRQELAKALPSYMVPSLWEWLDTIPLLPNGKVNRQQLIGKTLAQLPATGNATDGICDLCLALQSILATAVSPSDSFVGLGGDSMSFIQVSILLEDRLGQLPDGWENMPFQKLLALQQASPASVKPASSSHWTTVDTTLLLRVVSIILVTLSHTGSHAIVLLATSTLFVVSGMSFSRFLRPAIQNTGSLSPTLRFIAKFGIPAALWEGLRSVFFHRLWLPDVLLMGTFFQKPGDEHFTLWYLDVLAFNILLLALIEKIKRWRWPPFQSGLVDTFRWDLGWVAIGFAVACIQVQGQIWDGTVGHDSVAPFKWFWMLALGLLITQARTVGRKIGVSLIVGGLAMLTLNESVSVAHPFKDQISVFFLCTVLLLIWVDRIPVPRMLRPAIVEIGSATLMIYIVNHAVINILMPKLGMADWVWLQVLLAMGTGLLVNRIVNRWTQRIAKA